MSNKAKGAPALQLFVGTNNKNPEHEETKKDEET
jgi:hypothetical protein